MRKFLTVLSLAGALVAFGAGPALAAPPIGTDCNSINELLHINNVRDCDNS